MRGEILETSADDVGISSRLLYMVHLLDVLRSAGGTLASTEVFQELVRAGLARQSDIDTMQASGETRFAKSVRFARVELVGASLLDCPSGCRRRVGAPSSRPKRREPSSGHGDTAALRNPARTPLP